MATVKIPKYIGQTTANTIFETKEVAKQKNPNVLYIVLDDLGFAQLGCYGSTIDTPNIDRLAKEGLRYNNFHTTAICSATRASLLTGANHHSVGVAAITEILSGCPNATGRIDPAYATVAEILHENDYSTYCVGKWHVLNTARSSEAGPFEDFPLGKGFDHYYGFLTGQMDQYHPELVRDNTFVEAPYKPKEGYHLSKDLTDNAINYLNTHLIHTPDKPFFLYLAYGAMHAPHHAPKEYIEKYKGRFDAGWDALREEWFENQKRLGVIPENTILTERNRLVKAWDELGEDEKKVFARYMEAFAGFLDYTDEQIGRVIEFLRQVGELDNTVVVFLSDNGASAEGGQEGRFNTLKSMDIIHNDNAIDYALEHIDEIGSDKAMNHYPIGWANLGNVPFPWYKSWTFSGGVKDPLIIRYPKLISEAGDIRSQYQHVIDVTPTVLDIVGVSKPALVKGIVQKPLQGESFKDSFANPHVQGRYLQYYEMLGNRAIYKNGWKAIVNHSLNDSYEEDEWELYHVEEDYSESQNVAEQYPDKLRELQDEFLIEAGKYGVFPLLPGAIHKDPLGLYEMIGAFQPLPAIHKEFSYITGPFALPASVTSSIVNGNFALELDVERTENDQQGTLLAAGSKFAGYSWYVWKNRLKIVFSYFGEKFTYYESKEELPTGRIKVKLVVEKDGTDKNYVTFLVNGRKTDSILLETGRRFVGGCGYFIGKDAYFEVSEDYESPFLFEGKIHKVTIDVAATALSVKEQLDEFFCLD